MGCSSSKLHPVAGGSRKIKDEEILPQIDAICRLVPDLRSLPGLHPSYAPLELKPSLLNNPNLLLYIKAYINNATSAIDFLIDIHKSLNATRKAILSLKDAIMFFNKRDYIQTLSNMKDFAAIGNPFTAQLFDEQSLIVEQHKAMKDALLTRKQKLTRKLSFVKLSRTVWKVVCKATLVLTLVSAMVLAILGMPPVATTTTSAGTAVINTVEQLLDAILKGRGEELKEEIEVIWPMFTGSLMGDNLETLRALVERVENHLDLLANDVEFIVRVEDEMAVIVAINGVRDRLMKLNMEINRLETKARLCISEIEDAVISFFKLIIVDNLID